MKVNVNYNIARCKGALNIVKCKIYLHSSKNAFSFRFQTEDIFKRRFQFENRKARKKRNIINVRQKNHFKPKRQISSNICKVCMFLVLILISMFDLRSEKYFSWSHLEPQGLARPEIQNIPLIALESHKMVLIYYKWLQMT